MDGPEAVVDAVANHQPGDVLKLTLRRPEEGETVEIDATLAEHPEEEGVAYLGVVIGGVFISQGFDDDHGLPGPATIVTLQAWGRGVSSRPQWYAKKRGNRCFVRSVGDWWPAMCLSHC